MEALQFIGLIALAFLAYKYLYLPFINRKKEDTEEIERKIGILSNIQKDMRELFNPYANFVEPKGEDDEYSVSYGGWIKLYGRTLHFSSDTEIADFKKKAFDLYSKLNNDETKKAQIETIFKEYEQRQNERNKQKEIMYLGLRKNFLEYDIILKKIFSDYKTILPKAEIIASLEKELNKSNSESELIFSTLTDKTTGILSQEYDKGWQEKYRYFGETAIETKMQQL
jgi:hypothetical protein